MRKLLTVVTAIMAALTCSPSKASVLNFSFSFTGTQGNRGTIIGEINGLLEGQTTSATAVYIDSVSSGVQAPVLYHTIL
jgi:hypothetical protein